MNVMILGAKPTPSGKPECQAHTELFERLGRIERCLEKIEKALAGSVAGEATAAATKPRAARAASKPEEAQAKAVARPKH